MRDRMLIKQLLSRPWALYEPILSELHDVILRHAHIGKLESAQIQQVIVEASDRRPKREALDEELPEGRRVDVSGGGLAYEVYDCVAVLPIRGVIARFANQVNDVSLPEGTSCEAIEAAMASIADNAQVNAVLLDIDSPGGSIDGVAELSDLIYAFNAEKPVIAQANQMIASAAYWFAAQATGIYLGETALVGAIGVYAVLHDYSKWYAEDLKTKVHIVKAGERKGDGVPGTEITEAMLADCQRLVNSTYAVFVEHVARGLNISVDDARELADGRVHEGRHAVKAGLADGVQSINETLALMIDQYSAPITGRNR